MKSNIINKYKIINDPVLGFITIPTELIFDLIEHPYFQRLRRIKQTGLSYYVYPGATHTRFLHALGAMHLMQISLEVLKRKKIKITDEEYEAACIAILLHDVGHGPFSHALENTLLNNTHHENISIKLIQNLNEQFNGRLDMALQMFLGKYHKKFFNDLISSQVDVDRLDYLKRDSFFSGVSEGNINSERIITMMNVHEDQLVFDSKGIYSLEKYLISRIFMYWQVYFHKTSYTAESLLIKVLDRAKFLFQNGFELKASKELKYFLQDKNFSDLSETTLHHFIYLDDSDIMTAIKGWIESSDKILSLLSDSVINRHLPKSEYIPHPISEMQIKKIESDSAEALQIENGSYFVQQSKIDLQAYTISNEILLLNKNNTTSPIHLHSEQRLSQSLLTPTTKYHIFYPRQINLNKYIS